MKSISELWIKNEAAPLMGGEIEESETFFKINNALAVEGFRVTNGVSVRHHYKPDVERVDFTIMKELDGSFTVYGFYKDGVTHSYERVKNINDALLLIAHYVPLDMNAYASEWQEEFPHYPANILSNKLVIDNFHFIDAERAINSIGKLVISFSRNEHELEDEDISDANEYIMTTGIAITHEDNNTNEINLNASGLRDLDLIKRYVKE